MENLHDQVVKLTAEILNKSWTPDPGTVSPFSSGSSINDNQNNDNHLEYYVQKDPNKPLGDSIADIFNSNFWTNGGDKMTEKTLDVDSSTTQKDQYENPGSSTTEPDPQSEIAITKAAVPSGANDEEGKGTYSTTANTTTEAPSAGETTEPVVKADSCPDCNKDLTLCECAGMSKADASIPNDPDHDDNETSEVEKKDFSDEKRKELAHQGKALPDGSFPIESEQDLKNAIQAYGRAKNQAAAKAHIIARAKALGKTSLLPEDWNSNVSKSLWDGAFSPNVKRGF